MSLRIADIQHAAEALASQNIPHVGLFTDVLPLGVPAVLIYRLLLYKFGSSGFPSQSGRPSQCPKQRGMLFRRIPIGTRARPARAPYSHASKCFDHLQLISQDAARNELRIHTQSSCVCSTALLSLPRLLPLFGWIASASGPSGALFVLNDIMGQRASFRAYGFCVPVSAFDLKVFRSWKILVSKIQA